MRQLNEAFVVAMEETDYAAGYMGVYPMKVNQIRQVVEGILGEDEASSFGLEVGSKAELVASLPYLTNSKRLLICNGYKSAEMIELMLAFQRLGRNVMPIVEIDSEFEAILAEAKQHEATPRFGMRVRLSAAGAGQWSESSGDDSKFGISMPDLLSLAQRLEDADLYGALCLLHFHLDSQIDSIQALKMAVKEITRIYVSLYRRGHRITYLDVGGGLGVNYNAAPLGGGNGGVDYSIQEYANVIVYAVKEVCDAENVPVPTLVAENGRAIAAHHSVLIVEAVSSTSKPTTTLGFMTSEEDHEVIRLLYQMATEMRPSNGQAHNLGRLLEAYHDAVEERHNAETLFAYGYLSPGRRKRSPSGCTGPSVRASTTASMPRSRTICLPNSRASTSTSWTRCSAISPSSSRSPTTGLSASGFRSCPSTGWMKSLRGAHASSISRATATERSATSSRRTDRPTISTSTPFCPASGTSSAYS